MADVDNFIQRVLTVVGTTAGVNRVVESAGIPVEALTNIPRWPTAIVNDAGGRQHRPSGKLEKRWIDVTVCTISTRDSFGDAACSLIRAIGKSIKSSLEYDKTQDIHISSDSDVQALELPSGHVLIYKTWRFEALVNKIE